MLDALPTEWGVLMSDEYQPPYKSILGEFLQKLEPGEKLRPSPNKKHPILQCLYCHKEYYRTRKWQEYCSDKCRLSRFNRDREESRTRDQAERLRLEDLLERAEARIRLLEQQIESLK